MLPIKPLDLGKLDADAQRAAWSVGHASRPEAAGAAAEAAQGAGADDRVGLGGGERL
ncbi:MAG TPA: hypothetical protein VNT03_19575 [Baekduia sp.]|nr:hypothetical protein [Baekduia sp.]